MENTNQWKRKRSFAKLLGDRQLYLMLLPGLLLILLFKLMPLSKITIAFQNFRPLKGIAGSDWVGLANFQKLFTDAEVWRVISNTVEINILQILFAIPLPMLMAVMINEITCKSLKKGIQTIIYIPHFFTWVVVYSVFYIVFGSGGVINTVVHALGGDTVLFFMNNGWFRFLLVFSDVWFSAGWGTIVYLAAITAIDEEIFDAAIVDGASRLKRIRYIIIPYLVPTLLLMLSIRLGKIMTSGFDQVLAFYNPTVYEKGDIISTYVYRTGIGQANFSYATAVGFFNSLVGLLLVGVSNLMSKQMTGQSVW